jgi:hypothetical protein
MDRQTIDQATFELDLYGFTVLPAVIPEAEAQRLSGVLDMADERIGIDYVYDNAYARSVPCAPALDDGFMALVDDRQALAVVERVMGPDLVLGSMNARIVRPGDPGQGLHSDIPAVHRRVIGTPVMLQVVWMLDGFTADKGATRIVPGSHRHPEAYPPEGRSITQVVQPEGPPGSVMIFNGQCWHGGGANRSRERRRLLCRPDAGETLRLRRDRWPTSRPRCAFPRAKSRCRRTSARKRRPGCRCQGQRKSRNTPSLATSKAGVSASRQATR